MTSLPPLPEPRLAGNEMPSVLVYSVAELITYAAAVRAATIEECAKVADKFADLDIADAIRALK